MLQQQWNSGENSVAYAVHGNETVLATCTPLMKPDSWFAKLRAAISDSDSATIAASTENQLAELHW